MRVFLLPEQYPVHVDEDRRETLVTTAITGVFRRGVVVERTVRVLVAGPSCPVRDRARWVA